MSNDIQGIDDFSNFVFSVNTKTENPQNLAIAASEARADAERKKASDRELQKQCGGRYPIDSRPSRSIFEVKQRATVPTPKKIHLTRRERRKIRERKNGHAVSSSKPPVFSPRFSKATIEIAPDMTGQELARLILDKYPGRLHNVQGHRGVALLERLAVESYAAIVKSDKSSTGLSAILAVSGEETKHTRAVSELLGILNLHPRDKLLHVLFRTNGSNGHSHKEVAVSEDKPETNLELSNVQTEVIKESIGKIAHGQKSYPQLIASIHDFLKTAPSDYMSVASAQLDLDFRVLFLQELGSLIDSSGNGRPVDLETLQTEFEFYELYSEADDRLKTFVNDCMKDFAFGEGNSFETRLDMIDFLEKRIKVQKLDEAKRLFANIVELKKSGVRRALSLFYDAYKAVNNNEQETTIQGHFTELELDLSLVKNRKDIKLECVEESFGSGSYKNMNPRINGLTGITTKRGITVDAIGFRTDDKKQLFFEHKSSGHALDWHKDRVLYFVRFANIRNAAPVIMFNRDLSYFKRNRGNELGKVLSVLREIKSRYPVYLGYTQPLIFDKDGHDITEALLELTP